PVLFWPFLSFQTFEDFGREEIIPEKFFVNKFCFALKCAEVAMVKLFLCFGTLLRDMMRGKIIESDLQDALFYLDWTREELFNPNNDDVLFAARENSEKATL